MCYFILIVSIWQDGDGTGDDDDDDDDDNGVFKMRDQGSLQRSRTAWMTSVGHKRITQEEINQR